MGLMSWVCLGFNQSSPGILGFLALRSLQMDPCPEGPSDLSSPVGSGIQQGKNDPLEHNLFIPGCFIYSSHGMFAMGAA